MDIGGRYINAVSARLIDEMAFSVLEVEGWQGLGALVRRSGQSLEFVFFFEDGTYRDFVSYSQLSGVMEYMKIMNCTRSRIVNVFLNGYWPEEPDHSYDNIAVANIRVDIDEGTVGGDTYGLERLVPALREYASAQRLERYTPVNLKSLYKAEAGAKPVITRAIIAVNIIMWLLMTLAGGSTNIGVLISFGAMYAPLVVKGQYWRFVTPMFLHVGLAHLAFNSYALYQLGGLAERIYGKYRFTIIYGVAGICGSVFSFLFTPAVSAGASGAIFGMLGALLYFGRKRPGVFRRGFVANLLTILAINLLIGFSTPGIDNFAHLGGLAGGYATSRLLFKKPGL